MFGICELIVNLFEVIVMLFVFAALAAMIIPETRNNEIVRKFYDIFLSIEDADD